MKATLILKSGIGESYLVPVQIVPLKNGKGWKSTGRVRSIYYEPALGKTLFFNERDALKVAAKANWERADELASNAKALRQAGEEIYARLRKTNAK